MNKLIFYVLSICFCLYSCKSTEARKEDNVLALEFDEQAHRGGRGLMPENTIPAMLDAIDRGVTTLELDLQITKDRKVLVSHDPYFSEKITTTPQGDTLTKEDSRTRVLYSMPYDSIKKYDVGLKHHPDFPEQKKIAAQKPLLEDLLKSSEEYAQGKGRTVFYNMEIKSKAKGDSVIHPPVEEFVDLVMDVVNKSGIKNKITIQSFDTRALQTLNKKYPEMITSYLIGKNEKRSAKELFEALGFTPQILSPEYMIVTPEMIDECHAMNVKVLPWTVNDTESIKKLKAMGVDGIITDYPNLFEATR
ncbi:MAG: glycerophosphodiester phosphodiesterase family protein [Dysgonomonas sp.]|nr:glycerophosphodiester phosphodiesterase family protein [Dysgonomonas sp.]